MTAACQTCGKPLCRKNKTGFCIRHVSAFLASDPGHGAKISAGMRRRLSADPVLREQHVARMRKAHSSPAAHQARKQRWERDKPWIAGNLAQPAGSEPRRRAGRRQSATKLSWCPPHLRDHYHYLTRKKRLLAAEARQMIEAQNDAELARWRRAHVDRGYFEPPALAGRGC